tara:strand:+ start:2895 stop:3242 length:348 start_codon:yes stop_codon:yes gene_type:complete
MNGIDKATILCDKCNVKAEKSTVNKNECTLRSWKCPSCNNEWVHPVDIREYEKFKQMHQKQFHVKLRIVGNSYAVSIPREIIDFQESMFEELNDIISMSLECPEKLSLFFSKKDY